jgi:hypothetical protein
VHDKSLKRKKSLIEKLHKKRKKTPAKAVAADQSYSARKVLHCNTLF